MTGRLAVVILTTVFAATSFAVPAAAEEVSLPFQGPIDEVCVEPPEVHPGPCGSSPPSWCAPNCIAFEHCEEVEWDDGREESPRPPQPPGNETPPPQSPEEEPDRTRVCVKLWYPHVDPEHVCVPVSEPVPGPCLPVHVGPTSVCVDGVGCVPVGVPIPPIPPVPDACADLGLCAPPIPDPCAIANCSLPPPPDPCIDLGVCGPPDPCIDLGVCGVPTPPDPCIDLGVCGPPEVCTVLGSCGGSDPCAPVAACIIVLPSTPKWPVAVFACMKGVLCVVLDDAWSVSVAGQNVPP